MTTPHHTTTVPTIKGVTTAKWASAARARVDSKMLSMGLDPVTALPLKKSKPASSERVLISEPGSLTPYTLSDISDCDFMHSLDLNHSIDFDNR
jgi:hypothetical protein